MTSRSRLSALRTSVAIFVQVGGCIRERKNAPKNAKQKYGLENNLVQHGAGIGQLDHDVAVALERLAHVPVRRYLLLTSQVCTQKYFKLMGVHERNLLDSGPFHDAMGGGGRT